LQLQLPCLLNGPELCAKQDSSIIKISLAAHKTKKNKKKNEEEEEEDITCWTVDSFILNK
jgi:hypothetical protein